jgi:hypothetical protein
LIGQDCRVVVHFLVKPGFTSVSLLKINAVRAERARCMAVSL